MRPARTRARFAAGEATQCNAPNGETLQTADARFADAGTQVGTSLWQVHTTSYDATNALPTPRFYEINTVHSTLKQTGQFYASVYSNDFNASIAAATSGKAYVTWTSNANGLQGAPCTGPQMRFSGRLPTDPTGHIGAGSAFAASASTYYARTSGGSQRWGDYSSVSIDPSSVTGCTSGDRAWIVNQIVQNATLWATRFGGIKYC